MSSTRPTRPKPDTLATYEVLLAQLDRYPELKNEVDYLAEFSSRGKCADYAGRIVFDEERGRSVQLRQAQGTPGSRGIPNRTELLCMDDERRLPSLHEKSHHRDSPARTQQQRVRPSATEGNPILPYANAPAAGVFYPPGAVGTQPYIRSGPLFQISSGGGSFIPGNRRHGEFDGWYRKVDNRITDSPKQDISREVGKNGPSNDLGKGAS